METPRATPVPSIRQPQKSCAPKKQFSSKSLPLNFLNSVNSVYKISVGRDTAKPARW
jgi:hypothetical protein